MLFIKLISNKILFFFRLVHEHQFAALFLCIYICFLSIIAWAQGLMINEFSNGPSGQKEYVELVVCDIENGCSEVDIRNFIIDDNNGYGNDGFGSSQTGSGVSAGHLRFKDIPRWASVPSGSIILIYNNSDKHASIPADDPDDSGFFDSIYILPANDTSLEGTFSKPLAGGGGESGL